MKKKNMRVMAKGLYMSNDTRVTGLNNNDLIIGPSGAGKTTGYVKPNLLLGGGSIIVADTKGALLQEVGPEMARRGYRVLHLDFSDLAESSLGYDPLDYIRRGEDGLTELYRIAMTGHSSGVDALNGMAAGWHLMKTEKEKEPQEVVQK